MAGKKIFKEVSQFSIIDELAKLPPVTNSALFKFETSGDWIYAKFLGRRHGVQTQSVDKPSTVLDVQILASQLNGDEGPTGKFSIFESTMISQIMDDTALNTGNPFYLRYDSLDKAKKGRVKKFSFKKLTEEDVLRFEKALDSTGT
jgi:hypothetical protein